MHLHALHVLFPSFPCLKVSVVFLLFSLSLSFSFLIMAPKKSIPSKIPIRRGSSSSSCPLESIRFRDEKARDDFFENFFDQAIHSKRQVICLIF